MVATAYQQERAAPKSAGKAPAALAPRQKAKREKRKRTMLRFFLDRKKPDEKELLDTVKWLKGQRLFTPFVRDGLRLMMDLKAQRTDVLFTLFDWLEGWMDVQIERRLNARLQDTNARLMKLESELAALKTTGQGAISQPPGPRPIPAPAIPGPADDDAPLVMRKAKSEGNSAETFLNAAFRLVQ